MSNSTTPSDKSSKKGANADTANKDLKTPLSETGSAAADPNKERPLASKKPTHSPDVSTGSALNNQDRLAREKTSARSSEANKNDPQNNAAPTQADSAQPAATADRSSAKASAIASKRTASTPEGQPASNSINTTASTSSPPVKSSGLATTLSVIAIALVIGLGGGLYYHGHNQAQQQHETILALQEKIDRLTPQMDSLQQSYAQLSKNTQNDMLSTLQTQLQDRLNQQQQLIASVLKESATQSEQFKALQSKVSTLSSSEANLWLLAEADFLVKQAVRKLNTEKDITTAIALLSSADASIRDMNDPSLHGLRNAIASDLTALSSIQRIDIDGTIIKIHQLSEQLDKMTLIKNALEDDASTQEDLTISSDVSDWKTNLAKSWKSFVADFITVTPINPQASESDKPELTANQGAYLRENIRLQLLIAAQAVPGYQSSTYHQALAKALSWVKEYYAPDNAINQAFISELEQLQKLDIQVKIPAQLNSLAPLNKLVDVRLRGLIAQNSQPVGDGK